MEIINSDKELNEINKILNKVKSKYSKLNNLNLICEKVLNMYNTEFNEYKRQIVITTDSDIMDDYTIKYIEIYDDFERELLDISMCKNKIIGVYIYYFGYSGQYDSREEIMNIMINMNDDESFYFFDDIMEYIDWNKHILDK